MSSRRYAALVVAVAMASATVARAQQAAPLTGFVALDSAHAPPALASTVTLHLKDEQIRMAVAELAGKMNVSIVFAPDLPGLDSRVSLDAPGTSSAGALVRMLDGSGIRAMVSSAGSVVLVSAPDDASRRLVSGVVSQPDGPLWGARLSLAGTRFEASSDLAGRFTFGNVPPGDYTVHAVRLGYAPAAQPLHVAGDGTAPSVALSMTPVAVPVAAVIVTPGYYGVMQPGMASVQALSRQQIETVPQLGEDVYRAISRLPGVGTTDFSAKFTVRGEPGEELAVTLDGLPLIEPFHLKDLGDGLSIIDIASLGGAELVTGGPSAEYGDQLAGIFRLHSLEPNPGRARTSVGVSLTNFRGMTQGGFASGKGSWLVSGRRGYLDLAFKLAKIADSIYPQYNDAFAKVTYALPGGQQLAAHLLHAHDNLHYMGTNDPSIDSHYASDYAWTTLEGRVGSRVRQQSVAWFGGIGWARAGSRFPMATSGPTTRVDDHRSLRTLGVRQDWSVDMGSKLLFKFGGELRHESAHYDYSRLLRFSAVENKTVVLVTDSTAADLRPESDRAGFYVSQRVRPVDAFTFEVGARYDRASHTGDAILNPRVNAAWQPTASTTLRGSWGDYSQTQSVFGLQVEDGVHSFAPAERARQTVIGVDQSLWNGISARAEVYDRDLTHVRARYVNATSQISPVPEVAYDRVLLAASGGRSRGVELSLERDGGKRMDWSVSYALSSSRERVDGAWIPRQGDEPFALHADWSFHPASNKWRLSLAELWHAGFPYTPTGIHIDTLSNGKSAMATFGPGALYSQRLPAYQRIDARWTRFFDTRTGRVTVFVEVFNLFNTLNLRDKFTNVSINGLNVYYYENLREQLPRIPSFGISWEF